jgi:hypothetical protein
MGFPDGTPWLPCFLPPSQHGVKIADGKKGKCPSDHRAAAQKIRWSGFRLFPGPIVDGNRGHGHKCALRFGYVNQGKGRKNGRMRLGSSVLKAAP